MTSRKYTYVDFRRENAVPQFAKTTNAVATAADNQEDYFRVAGNYFEYIQTGANAAIFWAPQSSAPLGWKAPLDNTDADGIELTQGIISGVTPMQFTIGTDAAFYIKAQINLTTRAGTDVLMVGFRRLAAYADVTTPATLNAYTDAAWVGVNTNAGAFATVTELNNGGITATALAKAAWADGESHTLEVYVSAAGAVTYKIDGAADANAVAFTFDATDIVVPSVVLVATGAGDPVIVLKTYECGFQ